MKLLCCISQLHAVKFSAKDIFLFILLNASVQYVYFQIDTAAKVAQNLDDFNESLLTRRRDLKSSMVSYLGL